MNHSKEWLRSNDSPSEAEQTLRVIANLPAPEGLVDRVQSRLRTAPRSGRILAWPLTPGGWGYGGALRSAAAAAIVCVVAGGGWRIYSHVIPAANARMLIMPNPVTPVAPSRGFAIGGSIHKPDPGLGPVLTHQVIVEPPNAVIPQPVVGNADVAKSSKQVKGAKPLNDRPKISPR